MGNIKNFLFHWLAASGEISGMDAEVGSCVSGRRKPAWGGGGIWQVLSAEMAGAVGLVLEALVAPLGGAHWLSLEDLVLAPGASPPPTTPHPC